MFFGLFRGTSRRLIDHLHGEIVAAAREPVLFTEYGIPDDLDGRFESLALHAALVLRRLNALPAPAPEIAQDLTDELFRHFDIALREMGVGDMSVPKRMKKFAEAFLGRAKAYHEALNAGPAALAAALSRNVYAGQGGAERLARYVQALEDGLAKASLAELVEGPIFARKPAAIA
ncbi:MAG TPA: ubiquinol-cytochrome C chaperone family protein [Methylovirgula sp.]|nr:ubiquinol-cytochrome C chaperone family protein [Methylovirgula sp.]